MGRPPYRKKNTNDLDFSASGIQKLNHLVWGAVAVDLSTFLEENPSCMLLQYMDGLLLTICDWEKCWERTKALLARLSEVGYKVAWKKAQICQQEV
jgi:hypothetical protein